MTQEKHIFQGEQPTEAENRKEVPTAGSYIPSLVPAENGASPPTLNGLIHPVLPLNWP